MDNSPPGSSWFMEFSRQEYWSGLSCPPPGDLPKPGTEPASLDYSCTGRQADSLPVAPPREPQFVIEQQFINKKTIIITSV